MKHHETYCLRQISTISTPPSSHLISSGGSVPSQCYSAPSLIFPELLTSITSSVFSSVASNRSPVDLRIFLTPPQTSFLLFLNDVIEKCPQSCRSPHNLCHLPSNKDIGAMVSECSSTQRSRLSFLPFSFAAFVVETLLFLAKSRPLVARHQVQTICRHCIHKSFVSL